LLQARVERGSGARLRIATKIQPLTLGESIAVMGVCLTVDRITSDGFEADASAETLSRTTLGRLPVGARLHLEQALRADARLGGHIVAGHVDAAGHLAGRRPDGESVELTFSLPRELARYVASKGSVTVDGVSLTVNEVTPDAFTVMLIPHTQHETSLLDLRVGAPVNLEVDVLARYVARWLEVTQAGGGDEANDSEASLLATLSSAGYR
jgi:riboflavin synthase